MSSELRTNFTNHLTVLRKAPKTKDAYLRAVSGLSAYYRCSPDRLSNDQVQEYLRYLIEDRKLSWSSCNVVLSGLVCFYRGFLKWNETRISIPPRPRLKQLPTIMSVAEVRRLIDAAPNLKHQTLLKTVYCAGLRVSEVVRLMPHHIESDPSRMLIRIEQGKGQKDRYTVLTSDCLESLRQYWLAYRPKQWLFPGAKPSRPLSISAAQRFYEAAKKKAGLTRGRGIHTLRHCFATHQLHQGTDIFVLQRLLGHSDIKTTIKYLHLTPERITAIKSPLEQQGERHG